MFGRTLFTPTPFYYKAYTQHSTDMPREAIYNEWSPSECELELVSVVYHCWQHRITTMKPTVYYLNAISAISTYHLQSILGTLCMSLSVLWKFDRGCSSWHSCWFDSSRYNCIKALSPCQPWQALIDMWLFRYRNCMHKIFVLWYHTL